jgi:rare lipoprotein A
MRHLQLLLCLTLTFLGSRALASLEYQDRLSAAHIAEIDPLADGYDFEVRILDSAAAQKTMHRLGITDAILAEQDRLAWEEEQQSASADQLAWLRRDDADFHLERRAPRHRSSNRYRPSPRAKSCVARNGEASYYGGRFNGRRTACGEIFDDSRLTAAHKTLPCGSRVKVTYHGRSVVVRINDAGPYAGGRVIDLSTAAARSIGLVNAGVGYVTLQVVACGTSYRRHG